jgi:hypothetical protein
VLKGASARRCTKYSSNGCVKGGTVGHGEEMYEISK